MATGESTAVKHIDETYDTPIPDELRPKYDAWYGQLPENLQYTGDYDLQGVWLEKLGRPEKYEPTQNGHLDDYGKKPNHPTFSSGSKWHDPKVPERTGGEWRKADDGTWDFYPGAGNRMSDEELKRFFDKYEKGNRVHPHAVRQDTKRGETADQVYERHAAAMDAVVPFIKAHEGFRPEAYLDPVGKWTIGYGQTEIGGRPVMQGDTIDEETATEFVRQRVRRNADAIYRNMEWTRNASSGALAALYDLAYNGGVGMIGPVRSPTLNRMGAEALTRDAVDEAVWSQLPTYVSAGGRRMRGLVKRRSDAISQFRYGS